MKPSTQQIAAAFQIYLKKNPLAKRLKTDDTLKISEDGTLRVNVTENVIAGNALPASSNATYGTIGVIDEFLEDL